MEAPGNLRVPTPVLNSGSSTWSDLFPKMFKEDKSIINSIINLGDWRLKHKLACFSFLSFQ